MFPFVLCEKTGTQEKLILLIVHQIINLKYLIIDMQPTSLLSAASSTEQEFQGNLSSVTY